MPQIRTRGGRAGDAAPAVTLEQVERWRLQAWGVVLVVLGATALVVVASTFDAPSDVTRWIPGSSLRFAVVALVIAISVYSIEKELRLRRVERLLLEERAAAAALEARVREHGAIAAAGKAANSGLEPAVVLERILDEALALLDAPAGAVLLVARHGALTPAVQRGDAPLSTDAAASGAPARGAATLEPVLAEEDGGSVVLAAPLVHGGDLLGVLVVVLEEPRARAGDDLRLLGLFAEPAAAAIVNARRFTDERARVAELLELDRYKTRLVGSVSRELRLRLAALRTALDATPRDVTAGAAADEARAELGRQVRLLEGMLGSIVDDDAAPGVLSLLRAVDAGALARMVAFDCQLDGQPLRVEAPDGCQVRADPEVVRAVLRQLVDNAHRHGAPPVTVSVTASATHATIEVRDRGPGVPSEDRERIFERAPWRGEPGPDSELGLAVVRGLVRTCGGEVWVDDAPGGGAAFAVRFPRWEVAPGGDERRTVRDAAPTGS